MGKRVRLRWPDSVSQYRAIQIAVQSTKVYKGDVKPADLDRMGELCTRRVRESFTR